MWSGGKDSTAMLARMKELGYPIDIVIFCDAGMELPGTHELIPKVEKFIGMSIKVIKSERRWDDVFYQKRKTGKNAGKIIGFPYTITPGCEFGRILKIDPANKEKQKGDKVYLGIACDEAKRTQKEGKSLNKREKGTLIYPLIEWKWTEQICYDYCKKLGLLNDLYKHFDRNGCYLCPKQSRRALFMLYTHYPHLWQKLKKYEKDCPHGFKPNFTTYNFEKLIKEGKTRFKMEGKLIR